MRATDQINAPRITITPFTLNGNDSIEVHLLGKLYSSRVVDADHTSGLVKIHGPVEKNRLINVPVNTVLEVGIAKHQNGYYRTQAKVIGATVSPAPLLVLALDTAHLHRVERRSFFRIEMPVDIEYHYNDGSSDTITVATARLSNISGGGVLFHDEHLLGAPIRPGDLVKIWLKMHGSQTNISVIGTVVHRRPNASGVPGLAVRFITDNKTQDTIIRHIFEYERRHFYPA